MFEVIIIGASAAGISSAIYLSRRGIKPLILGFELGGEMALSGEVGNYPGFGQTNGVELTEKFLSHLRQYQAEPVLGVKITGLKKADDGFTVEGWKDSEANQVKYQAKAVIIASGAHPRELNVPGEKELRGKGVSYCTVCDGPLFKDKVVVIIGGGDSANEAGIMMNEIAQKTYLITKNPEMKGDPSLIRRLKESKNVEIIPKAMTEKILGDGFVSGIEYKDLSSGETKTIQAQGVFIHIGMIPNSDFVMPELAKNERGEIIIDKFCRTNLPGVFAAGDITDVQYKQIGIAVGQGICAGLSAVDYLNKLD
ncbi:MAG: FAD-dependent oxidoreductase [Patescibacteria group bacterium]